MNPAHDAQLARAIAVLGSASDVGKSLVAAGLCRLFSDAGLDVAPFKAQNMANQAGVTPEGLEMPRAQILQAQACRLAPHVDMGPVLLKPLNQTGAQVIVLGRAAGIQEAKDYFRDTSQLAGLADAALLRLAARHELIVMEGAGSPVELNLMDRDFVNLRPARRLAGALVLVLDIHKGGVFAQAKGTLDLLPPEDRSRVIGLVVNRFKGDASLFEAGITQLEAITGVPVLAVVPHLDHALDEEDRPFRIPVDAAAPAGTLKVGALLSPRVSNTEDLAPLLAEPDLYLTWITDPRRALEQDLLILPGSKATVADLAHHASTGLAEAVRQAHARGAWILGLCGGYQMLGQSLLDEAGTEGGPASWPGLGLLPTRTVFRTEKATRPSDFESLWPEAGHALSGYEIHHGQTELVNAGGSPLLMDIGAEAGWHGERALGSYLHGLLGNDAWRAALLNQIRSSRGLPTRAVSVADPLENRIQRWAEHLRRSLRPGAWERLLAAARPA
ncbi:cobyric acid synthase [Geothrix limicola]|uniref:Cobyric acid synthase n=1 Tax=Geothrix limicola TaxID=2927978 RepID=A0ABQ5QGB2_9BACT|nr:cobyric acid synthase [Geothrix limicola]GLH73476.1 cobyric acid synthase [Geothrix limicola]